MEHTEITKNLELFKKLISCGNPLYLWTYNAEQELLDTNCPYAANISNWNDIQTICSYAQEHHLPVILSNSIGMIWLAAFEKHDDMLRYIYVAGPAFTSKIHPDSIKYLLRNADISVSQRKSACQTLLQISVIPPTSLLQYTLMLHCCITGETLSITDIRYLSSVLTPTKDFLTESNEIIRDRNRIWMIEQAMLHQIKTGNLNYKSVIEQGANLGFSKNVILGNPLGQAKLSAIMFTTLSVRAAISGGLSPEFAYSHGDTYIRNIAMSHSITEIANLVQNMYDDFIHAVHTHSASPEISPQIQRCMDYIVLHLNQPLSLESLAKKEGYTKYYLSKKFRSETGLSVNEYIKKVRIEQAKILLLTTDLPIQAISEQLQFCTRSYFTDTFRKLVGMTPAEYRISQPEL